VVAPVAAKKKRKPKPKRPLLFIDTFIAGDMSDFIATVPGKLNT